ncbi:MAG: Zn-ribbon domain-containing OB-fold protein [Microthrixaceae bacterium]
MTDLPSVDHESVEWWAAVHEGRLLLERCGACAHLDSIPRGFCPQCWSEDVEWVDACGDGVIYTFSVVRVNDLAPFAQQVPYVVAMVDLAEGPRVMSRIAGVDPDAVSIGMAVTFRPRALDERSSAPEFVPIGGT